MTASDQGQVVDHCAMVERLTKHKYDTYTTVILFYEGKIEMSSSHKNKLKIAIYITRI